MTRRVIAADVPSSSRWITLIGVGMVSVVLAVSAPAWGIILHDPGDPAQDTPPDAVVGRWIGNASAVAIGRAGWSWTNYIITTTHQAGSSGSVWFGQTEYTFGPEDITPHPFADLRIVQLQTPLGADARLTHYAQWYTDTDEVGKDIVVGGYGNGWDVAEQTDEITYGYLWDGSANTTLRWGTNKIERQGTVSEAADSGFVTADFDGLGEGDSTDHEASIASFDSGGGWFTGGPEGQWLLVALSRGVENHNSPGLPIDTWFRNRSAPEAADPDLFDAIRLSSHKGWINGALPAAIPGDPDLDDDDFVGQADLDVILSHWGQDVTPADPLSGDPSGDGFVGQADLDIVLAYWGQNMESGAPLAPAPSASSGVPEPGTILLVCGATVPALLKRTRRPRP